LSALFSAIESGAILPAWATAAPLQWEARGETVKALAEAARATKAATSDLSMMVQYKSKGVGLQSTPSLKEKVMEVFCKCVLCGANEVAMATQGVASVLRTYYT
jgi:hypothetical protein